MISEELKVDDVINDEPSSKESARDDQSVLELESTKMNFVEGKLLSHERDKETAQHSTVQHTRGQQFTGYHRVSDQLGSPFFIIFLCSC